MAVWLWPVYRFTHRPADLAVGVSQCRLLARSMWPISLALGFYAPVGSDRIDDSSAAAIAASGGRPMPRLRRPSFVDPVGTGRHVEIPGRYRTVATPSQPAIGVTAGDGQVDRSVGEMVHRAKAVK